MSKLTIGSLFDGIGGFPIVAQMYGVEPVWASEIKEPCIRITKRHFPNMKHYGDITKMDGAEIEPVDIISGGSPCTDLSVAGKQEGISRKCTACGMVLPLNFSENLCPKCGAEIEFTRSGLFMEQIRIIKEMRKATNNHSPKIVVWENVCFTEDALVTCDTGFKPIKDVCVGDKVKTMSGEYHTVAVCHRTKYQHVVSLSVRGALPITVTPNHPFYARLKTHKGNNRVISDPMWVQASDLTSDHMIGYRIDIPTLPDDFISEIDAWIIGRWLADGSVDLTKSNPRIFISVGNNKIDSVREKLKESTYDIYENRVHETAINFTFTSRPFYNLIANAGVGAGNKRVPAYIFRLPQKLQRCVLEGYISGDGCVKHDGGSVSISAGTASKELAYGVARLVRNCLHVGVGITMSYPKHPVIDGRELSVNHPTYNISYCLTQRAATTYFDGEYVWQMVKSVEPLSKTETVYNLSILEDNTYEVNTVICHNCGALSSNNGDDFQVVLSEFAGLFGEKLPTLRPEKWCKAGEIVGDNGSLAWRTLDAQYWGVPQRRRRIYLVVDLTGQRAGEILFKSESLRRHTPQGEVPWKRTTSEIKSSIGAADRTGKAESEEVKPLAIATQQVNAEMSEDVSPTLTAANGTSGSNRVYVVLNDQGGSVMDVSENITGTLRAESHGHTPIVVDSEKEVYGICSMASNCMKSDNPDSGFYKADVSKTLDTSGSNPSCNQGGNVVVESPVYCIQGNCIDRADTAGCNGKGWKEDVAYTLTTIDRPAVAYSVHENQVSDVTITEELASTITTGGGKPGQGYPCVLEEKSAKAYGVCSKGNGDTFLSDKAYTMTTGGGQAGQGYPCILEDKSDCAAFLGKQGDAARGIGYSEKVAPTLTAGEPPQVVEYNEQIPYAGGGFADYDEGKFATLKASGGDVGGGSETLVAGFAYQVGPGIPHLPYTEEKSPTLVSNQQMGVLIDNHGQDCRWKECKDGICPTLNANMGMGGNNQPLYIEPNSVISASKASFFTRAAENNVAECLVASDYKDPQIVLKPNSVVRRLTPIECARLQGFPDTWLDGESDAAQYKALGNSVALPCVDYVISGVVDVLDPID